MKYLLVVLYVLVLVGCPVRPGGVESDRPPAGPSREWRGVNVPRVGAVIVTREPEPIYGHIVIWTAPRRAGGWYEGDGTLIRGERERPIEWYVVHNGVRRRATKVEAREADTYLLFLRKQAEDMVKGRNQLTINDAI